MAIRHWQRLGRKFFLGGGLMLGLAGAHSAWGQTPVPMTPASNPESAPVRRNYMNKSVIDLPITMDDAARGQIQEIHLYVRDHANSPWILREKGSASQQAFRFQAPRDGEFWFTMVTVDKQGKSYPQDLQNEPPGLIVVIDTQRPVVEMTNLGQGPEGHLIQCTIKDPNLDNARMRFFYQGGDKVFRPLDPMPTRPGVFCIPAQAVFTGVVRATAQDLAGNQTISEDTLDHLAKQAAPLTTQQVGVNPLINPNVTTIPDVKMPNPLVPNVRTAPELEAADPRTDPRTVARLPQLINEPTRSPAHRPDGVDGPRYVDHKQIVPAETTTAAKHNFDGVKRQIVNSARVFLDYQIETKAPGQPSNVEVWLTRDRGQSWQKIAEDPQRKSPIEVMLPGEGLFGLTLQATPEKGTSVAPRAGHTADWWIEVDSTNPVAYLNSMKVMHDKGQASVHIQWTAKDANLADTPVDLFYAASPQGPWLPIAKGLQAEGTHRWTPPTEIGLHTHVRLIARDAAGNQSICNTTEPVSLEDATRPRVTIRNVRTEPSSPQLIPAQPQR